MLETSKIPTFYLYGEPHRSIDDGFVHVEALDDRSRPSEWTIRPHQHAELNHIFLIATGSGTVHAEERLYQFVAPSLLVVPAGLVHGFTWAAESSGWVVTFSTSHLKALCQQDPDLGALFRIEAVIPLDTAKSQWVAQRIGGLMREFGWASPGHRAATNAGLLDLMVLALREIGMPAQGGPPAPGQQAALVARFRQRIEDGFRQRASVATHAAALGVSLAQLRGACAKVARQSPAQMLDQRTLLEAKRTLLYTNLPVAEVGYALGFADPAYFSRFFSRNAGCSPRRFRDTRGESSPR